MRGWIAIAWLAACGGSKPAPAPAPAPIAEKPVAEKPACDARAIQPMLDTNVALSKKWGDLGVSLGGVTLVPAIADAGPVELEAAPGGEPVYVMGKDGGQWHGDPTNAEAVVLVIDRDMPWGEVVRLVHDVAYRRTLRFAFAIDPGAALPDRAIRRDLDVAKARTLGAEFQARCPAVADLFMPHDDLLAYVAQHAGPALASCGCAITPDDFALAYETLLVPDYVAVRSIYGDRHGLVVSARSFTPFAQVAPKIMAVVPVRGLAFEIDH